MNTPEKRMAAVLAVMLSAGAAFAEEHDEEAHERHISQAEVMQFVDEFLPELVEGLRELRREAADAFDNEVKELTRFMRELREIREHSPEVAEAMIRSHRLEAEAERLVQRIAEEESKDEIRDLTESLEQTLGEVFDLRLSEPEFHIGRMEKEIEALRDLIKTRKQNRAVIIKRRMDDMLGETDESMQWW